MARGKTQQTDPRAKRPQENYLQWRSRIAAIDRAQQTRNEPLVTLEAMKHGNYVEEFIMHVETQTLAKATRNRQQSSLRMMHDKGSLTAGQYLAALDIATVAERIERSVSVRGASLEARVDTFPGRRDVLFERLAHVRMEAAYTRWRQCLPMPRRMVIDMVLADRDLKATARVYGMGWPRAQTLLRNALDKWIEVAEDACKMIDQDDLNAAHARIERAA